MMQTMPRHNIIWHDLVTNYRKHPTICLVLNQIFVQRKPQPQRDFCQGSSRDMCSVAIRSWVITYSWTSEWLSCGQMRNEKKRPRMIKFRMTLELHILGINMSNQMQRTIFWTSCVCEMQWGSSAAWHLYSIYCTTKVTKVYKSDILEYIGCMGYEQSTEAGSIRLFCALTLSVQDSSSP